MLLCTYNKKATVLSDIPNLGWFISKWESIARTLHRPSPHAVVSHDFAKTVNLSFDVMFASASEDYLSIKQHFHSSGLLWLLRLWRHSTLFPLVAFGFRRTNLSLPYFLVQFFPLIKNLFQKACGWECFWKWCVKTNNTLKARLYEDKLLKKKR